MIIFKKVLTYLLNTTQAFGIKMKQTKRQRKVKTPSRLQVTSRKWSKKTSRILDKQFDRYIYEVLYVPVSISCGRDFEKYERNMWD